MSQPDLRDLAAAHRLIGMGISADTAYRSQTVRRLATIRTKLGRSHTGTLVQDSNIDHGWVTDKYKHNHYGRIVATHGCIWPDGKHEEEKGMGYDCFNDDESTIYAPYVPPPEDWVYIP